MVTGTGGIPMGGSPGKNQPMGESEDNLGDNMNDLGLEDDGMDDDIGASDLPDAGMPGDDMGGMPGEEAGMDAGMPGGEGMGGDDLGMGGDKGTCSLSKLREVLEAEYPEISVDELMSKVQDTGAESGAGDLDALGGGGDDMGMGGGDDLGMGDMGGDELAGAPGEGMPDDDMEKVGECMEGVGDLNESYTPDESRARFGRRALVSPKDISKVAALLTDDPDVFN